MLNRTLPQIADPQSPARSVPTVVVSAEVLLGELPSIHESLATPYLLVQSPDGLIEGIVDLQQVRRLLSTDNAIERERWEQVAVGTIADRVLTHHPDLSERTAASAGTPATLPMTPVIDDAGCVAIVANGETYVSWSRVAATISQNQVDPVTLLPTRMMFNRRLQEEVDRAARTAQALAVLMIDLDYLKQINDTFGHSAGDAALRLVADCLRAGVRSYDFVARLGGDEFSVICYDCKPQHITVPIRRLQQALATLSTGNVATPYPISLSIGMAVATALDERCPPGLLLDQADACLYRAKRSGRARAYAVEVDSFGIPVDEHRLIGLTR